jgi:hypothetical protein
MVKYSASIKIPKSTWFVAFACFISWGALAARPATEWQLASVTSFIGALILLVGKVVQGAIKWRQRGLVNLISCLLIVAALVTGSLTGRLVRSLQLSYDLARYNAAAQWILTHSYPDSTNHVPLPSRYAELGYGVNYERDSLCGTKIDFFWGEAFPVKHVVRRYATDPRWISIEGCSKGWARITPISTNWYEMSD